MKFVGENTSLLEFLPLRDIVHFYDCELLLNNIPKKTDLRKFFIHKHYISLQNQGCSNAEIYDHLMEITGFKTKENLLRLAF